MAHLEEINKNHERFKKTNEAIDKLRIAAHNAVIQFKAATKALEELSFIAESLGYKIDKNDGSLNLFQDR